MKLDTISIGLFKHVWLPKGAPNMDKESIWQDLLKDKRMLPARKDRRNKETTLLPTVICPHKFEDKFDIKCQNLDADFPETYTRAPLRAFLSQHPSRVVNLRLREQYLEAELKELQKPRKGKMGNEAKEKAAYVEKSLGKLLAKEKLAYAFLEHLDSLAPGPKRRRLQGKRSTASDSQPDDSSQNGRRQAVVESRVAYRYTLGDAIRTRQQATKTSAQRAFRLLLRLIADHTIDLDIENCMFVILDQMADKMEIPMPDDLRRLHFLVAGVPLSHAND